MESVTNFSDQGSFSGDVVRIDEGKLRGHVDQVVRASVEETLNGLLEAEADQLCNAKRYERTPDRVDTRAGTAHLELTLF
jgi:putative transposase